MALFLSQTTLDGVVIAVFAQNGEHATHPDPAYKNLQENALNRIESRDERQPWAEYVEQCAASFNHRYIWGDVTSNETDIEQVFADLS